MNLRSEVNISDAHDGVEVREARELCGVDGLAGAGLPGRLVEFNATRKIFSNPDDPSTEAYISGRFG